MITQLSIVKGVLPQLNPRSQHCAAQCLRYLQNQQRWQERKRATWTWVKITVARLQLKLEQYGEKLVSLCLRALVNVGLIERRHIKGRSGKAWEYLPKEQNCGIEPQGCGIEPQGCGTEPQPCGLGNTETFTETDLERSRGELDQNSSQKSDRQRQFVDDLNKGSVQIDSVPSVAIATELGETDLLEHVLTSKANQPGVAGRNHATNIYRKHPKRLAADLTAAIQSSIELVRTFEARRNRTWFDMAKSYIPQILAMTEGVVFVSFGKDAVSLGKIDYLKTLSFDRLSSLVSEVCNGKS